jgi:hypothetical protein
MQAGAALAPGVSQQAFKHVTGIRVAGVMPAHVTPSSKIPINGESLPCAQLTRRACRHESSLHHPDRPYTVASFPETVSRVRSAELMGSHEVVASFGD